MGMLRFYLAYVVLVAHCPQGLFLQKLSHPALAVQCFYAISGFYVQLLLRDFARRKNKFILSFYFNRFIRIYPTYFIFLLATIICFHPNIFSTFNGNPTRALAFFASNILIITQWLARCWDGSINMLPQAWTLSLEILFYLIAPFILFRSVKFIVGLIALSLICRIYLAYHFNLYLRDWFYGFFPSEIAIFLLGSLAYRFYENFLSNLSQVALQIQMLLNGLVFCFLIWFTFYGWFNINVWQWDDLRGLGAPLRYWDVLGLTIISLPFIFQLFKNSKVDRYIGEFSYPVYLGHFFFISLYENRVPDGYLNVAVLLSTIMVSVFLMKYVELPLSNYRARQKMKRHPEDKVLTNEVSDPVVATNGVG